jgi:hypothetical protein
MGHADDFPAGEALASWYAARPAVRRLRAVREFERMRILIALGPTLDGDEIYPAWLANGCDWAQELQSRLGEPVRLEVMNDPFRAGLAAGVLVADLCWRDSSILA